MDIFKFLRRNKLVNTAERAYDEMAAKTARPVMRLELTNEEPSLFESKIGGIPYLPHSVQMPRSAKGNPLYLLAQINCTDLNGLQRFPASGLLQFFIGEDDLYGADFDHPTKQDGFRVVYYKNIDTTVTETEVKEHPQILPKEKFFPVLGSYGVSFALEAERITLSDFKFDRIFTESKHDHFQNHKLSRAIAISDDVYDALFEKYSGFGHKMGGYPGFTQEDPRSFRNGLGSLDTVLLQIDSEFGNGFEKTMWGDSGICNFFINGDALSKCDFSNVAYNWDCY